MKYVFKQIDTYTPSETTVEFTADTLSTVLEQFEMFLRGSGFYFTGNLDFVHDEETPDPYVPDVGEKPTKEESQSIYEDGYESPSFKVFQHTVNSLMNPPKFRANEEKQTHCPVCNISRSEMNGYKCWDKRCPLPESALNAN